MPPSLLSPFISQNLQQTLPSPFPMGNCSQKLKRQCRSPKPLAIQLHGSETSLTTWRIRVQLLYKHVRVEFVESGTVEPFLRCGAETVMGSEESLIRYIEKRFGGKAKAKAKAKGGEREGRGMAAEVMVLQHRSIQKHVEGMAEWAEKMTQWKGRAGEGRLMGKFYGELVEIMLEHAQMEERFLFPALESAADYGIADYGIFSFI